MSDRNRALRFIYEALSPLLKDLTALNLSDDRVANAGNYFKHMETSVYMGQNHIDIQNIPRDDGAYDFVVCNHILEHVEDDAKAIRELSRVARRCIQITVPITALSFNGREYGSPDPQQYGHYRHYGADFPKLLSDTLADTTILSCVVRDEVSESHDVVYLVSRDREFAREAFDTLRKCGVTTVIF